jgi:MFS family permease
MTPPLPATKSTSALRIGLAASVGTALEFYDFAIYGTAAALVFNDIFFTTGNAWFGTFMSLATFAIGFVAAPAGAAVFGWLGDRHGRRIALIGAFFLMGLATLAIGVLPSYAAIGITAPILVVVLRIFHGAARGGENTGAAVFAIEHAPAHQRGLYGSFVAVGSPIGNILANLTFALVLFLPAATVTSWGWRIPFLIGGLVLVIGLWVRKGVAESPVFEEMANKEDDKREKTPIVAVLRTNWRRVLLAAGVNLGLTATTFTLAVFMLSYATAPAPNGLGLPRGPVVNGALIALLCHAVLNVVSAWISDRVGRKPVMLVGAALSIIAVLTMFHVAAAGTVAAVTTATILTFAASGILFGPLYTFFAEQFPGNQRQSGAGIGYHVGAVLGGGITPMIANRIIASTGSALNVGYYLAALLALSFVCICVLPETAPARLRGSAHDPVDQVVLPDQPAAT